jgi:hypothetical protein
MPVARTFTANGKQITIKANENGSLTIQLQGNSREFEDLNVFMHFYLTDFQALYPQLQATRNSTQEVWNQAVSSALDTLGSSYPVTMLSGSLGVKDPMVLGPDPMKVLEAVTDQKFQPWSFSRNTLAAIQAKVLEITNLKNDVEGSLSSARTASDKALKSKAGPRHLALHKIDQQSEALDALETSLAKSSRELNQMLHELSVTAQRSQWEIATKQPESDDKTFRVKIKLGKFRQLIFFSRYRHSIPYFLQGQWSDENMAYKPDSKFMNTLTILTAGQLETAFMDFVTTQYIPFLNLKGHKAPVKFSETYQTNGAVPIFEADKYYGNQGMHCTPVTTANIAFTLTQAEHALLYRILMYVRDPVKAMSVAEANAIADGLRQIQLNSEFANMAQAYPKLAAVLVSLPGRPSDGSAKSNLLSSIRDFDKKLSLGMKL